MKKKLGASEKKKLVTSWKKPRPLHMKLFKIEFFKNIIKGVFRYLVAVL